ncbi:MAG: hypothetical protein WBM90_13455, partial [Acidimicrobiia bacterium]
MKWARTRSILILALLALILAACGGGDSDGSSDTTASSEEGGSGSSNEPVDQESDDPAGQPGERSAIITVDGVSTNYALDDVTFSQVEGIDDITFETCSPDFFGSGRFYAIGYAVDGNGEVIVGDDGSPGTFSMDLPPDDWEATQRDAPDFQIKNDGLDIRIASPDVLAERAPGGTMSWTVDDTSASGSAVFVDFDNTYTVDFEVVCEGEPTITVDNPPDNSSDNGGGGGSPPPLAGAGVGSFTADGQSFENVDVY